MGESSFDLVTSYLTGKLKLRKIAVDNFTTLIDSAL